MRKLSLMRSNISAYSGPRWLIICRDAIFSTSSGSGTGPGMRRLGCCVVGLVLSNLSCCLSDLGFSDMDSPMV